MRKRLKLAVAIAAVALPLLTTTPGSASPTTGSAERLPVGATLASGKSTSAPAASAWVRIRSLYGNKDQCLDADANAGGNGTRVQVWTCNGSSQQAWLTYSDSYRLVNGRFGRCLDADLNGGGANGTKLQLWDCNGSTQQSWYRRGGGDVALYNIRFSNNDNTVVDRDANQPGNGARAQLWVKNFQPQQWWVIEAL
ncbi:RICIN domain-containing protein [Actinokineospora diospyrosa]|uniref:Ricin-type beta-trefoil lectin domain-containing protein n=1 Tax=Actinokineospora diospyrosa TaxID=103728 RepID=A0ABT1I9P5_9PSEU|nr:RICIN domain-containing protein [Actinokineospora diospyrosa]MCP2269352.1 Ricin-type beta-trefoil lectin domain-containing protein [Actinokineospora diospyrosa]